MHVKIFTRRKLKLQSQQTAQNGCQMNENRNIHQLHIFWPLSRSSVQNRKWPHINRHTFDGALQDGIKIIVKVITWISMNHSDSTHKKGQEQVTFGNVKGM